MQGFAQQVHIGELQIGFRVYRYKVTMADSIQDTLLARDEIGTPMMERIRNHLPEESQYLLSGRVQIIK